MTLSTTAVFANDGEGVYDTYTDDANLVIQEYDGDDDAAEENEYEAVVTADYDGIVPANARVIAFNVVSYNPHLPLEVTLVNGAAPLREIRRANGNLVGIRGALDGGMTTIPGPGGTAEGTVTQPVAITIPDAEPATQFAIAVRKQGHQVATVHGITFDDGELVWPYADHITEGVPVITMVAGDVNMDGSIGLTDLLEITDAWGTAPDWALTEEQVDALPPAEQETIRRARRAAFDGGTTVGTATMASLIDYWGGEAEVVGGTGDLAVPEQIISFSATQFGGVYGTTATQRIRLTFSSPVPGLTNANIGITNGTGSVVRGALTGGGAVWYIGVRNVQYGTVTVTVNLDGVQEAGRTVTVYYGDAFSSDTADGEIAVSLGTNTPASLVPGTGVLVGTTLYFVNLTGGPEVSNVTLNAANVALVTTLANGGAGNIVVFDEGILVGIRVVATTGANIINLTAMNLADIGVTITGGQVDLPGTSTEFDLTGATHLRQGVAPHGTTLEAGSGLSVAIADGTVTLTPGELEAGAPLFQAGAVVQGG